MPDTSDYDDLCVCDHKLRDHHISWFSLTGARIVEECEHEECRNLPWDQTCNHFRLAAAV